MTFAEPRKRRAAAIRRPMTQAEANAAVAKAKCHAMDLWTLSERASQKGTKVELQPRTAADIAVTLKALALEVDRYRAEKAREQWERAQAEADRPESTST